MLSGTYIAVALITVAMLGVALGFLVFRRLVRPRANCAVLQGQASFFADKGRLLETVIQNTRDGILIHDIHGRIEWANDAYLRMSGRDLDEIIGRRPQEFMLPHDQRPSEKDLATYKFDIAQENLNSYEVLKNVRKTGEEFWCSLSFGVVEPEPGHETRIVVVSRDVTDQINHENALTESNRRAEFQAGHDALTGLPNRAKFTDEIEAAHADFKASGRKYGILHIDLDKFKAVNDTLGHAAGDAVLVSAAKTMKQMMREGDLLCRFGGDEFIAICRNVAGFEPMRIVASRLIDGIAQPIDWQGKRLEIGASIGIAIVSDTVENAESLVRNADMALYEVKNNGRNNFACYDETLGRAHMREQRIAAELNLAIERGDFSIVLQPQYSLIARTVTGFEALLRWNHPERGLLAPPEFLDMANRNGLMARLDRISVAEALRAIRKVHQAGFGGLKISINASASSLLGDDYLSYLKWQTDLLDMEPNEVIIEVLETTFFSDTDLRAERMLRRISEAGFRLELDDFGTGFAGLAHLAHLRIDGVKIDRSMIQDLENSTTSQIIVEATVGLGRDLGLHVIAEGVENAEQAALLREFGCANVQGYGIARPMAPADAIAWLKATDMSALLQGMGPAQVPETGETQNMSATF